MKNKQKQQWDDFEPQQENNDMDDRNFVDMVTSK
jgi:hypothetical protein